MPFVSVILVQRGNTNALLKATTTTVRYCPAAPRAAACQIKLVDEEGVGGWKRGSTRLDPGGGGRDGMPFGGSDTLHCMCICDHASSFTYVYSSNTSSCKNVFAMLTCKYILYFLLHILLDILLHFLLHI